MSIPYFLLIQCNYTQKMIIFIAFDYNSFPMHVQIYASVSGLHLHVKKFCKHLLAKNETLLFTRVNVAPLSMTIVLRTFMFQQIYKEHVYSLIQTESPLDHKFYLLSVLVTTDLIFWCECLCDTTSIHLLCIVHYD